MRKLILSVDELQQESEINMNNIPKMLQEKNILIKRLFDFLFLSGFRTI